MRYIHITAGLIALIAGAIALYSAKGGAMHRKSGTGFVLAMWTMTLSAAIMAGLLRPNRLNFVAALTTFYLVSTAWLAVKRTLAQSRGWHVALLLLALSTSAYAFSLAAQAANSANGRIDGMPPQPLYMFALVCALGAALDARLLLAGSIEGAHRIARHLWRMGLAMWIGTASFFLGQAKFFPQSIRKSGLLAIPVLLLALYILWSLVRVLKARRARAGASAYRPDARDGQRASGESA